jgi:hypothetical protein
MTVHELDEAVELVGCFAVALPCVRYEFLELTLRLLGGLCELIDSGVGFGGAPCV